MLNSEGYFIDSPVDVGKENLLILFKYASRWNSHVVQILERQYNVYYGYFSEFYAALGTLGLCEHVKRTQVSFEFRALLIDSEWCDIFNIATVELLDQILPVGLMLFDDSTMHDYNRVLASRASFALVACPSGIVKYQELDIKVTQFFPISESFYVSNIKLPEYDVLWFGYPDKADRLSYVTKLEQMSGLKVRVHTGKSHEIAMSGDLTWQELSDVIASAKIIVNLSKSDFPFRCAGYSSLPRPEVYQFAGRIIEAGYAGRLCISQYSPHHSFGELKKFMVEFSSPEEMEGVIRTLLVSERFSEYTRDFCGYIRSHYGNELWSMNVRSLIDGANKSSHRYVTRVNQQYYDIAWSAIKSYPYKSENMRGVEVDLLNQACQRVSGNFQLMDSTMPHTSQAKIYVNR
ncbi:hypothetical protein DLREEDagrD3_27240 [Denitratisoma sp. agr-D3]